MQISSLHTYPVKSGRVIDVSASRIDLLGLEYDRRWVIIEKGRFIAQRSHPPLARLIATPSEDKLSLSFEGAQYDLDLGAPKHMAEISVWKDDFQASIFQDPVNDWLSKHLGGEFELASMDQAIRRRETDERASPFDVSFADGYPILIATTASLQALNDYVREQGETALPMSRFRPNIVIDGAQPWAEDSWKQIKIGNVIIDCVKPCTRCIMTTLDPISGDSLGDMSLKALTHLRRSADKRLKGVLFGTNAIPLGAGLLKQGDKVEILETQMPWAVF